MPIQAGSINPTGIAFQHAQKKRKTCGKIVSRARKTPLFYAAIALSMLHKTTVQLEDSQKRYENKRELADLTRQDLAKIAPLGNSKPC
jgi:hypothetical protein